MGVHGRAEFGRPRWKGDDVKALTAAATMTGLVVLLPLPASAVSARSYDRVEVHWSRQHVQRVFHGTGTRVLMWAGPHHRHLVKTYPADDGGTYVISYVGPLRTEPYAGPYVVQSKDEQG
jgi:hypothetical protein